MTEVICSVISFYFGVFITAVILRRAHAEERAAYRMALHTANQQGDENDET